MVANDNKPIIGTVSSLAYDDERRTWKCLLDGARPLEIKTVDIDYVDGLFIHMKNKTRFRIQGGLDVKE